MIIKSVFAIILALFFYWDASEYAWAKVTIDSQLAVEIKLNRFDGLAENNLLNARLSAIEKYDMETPYRGLALLTFPGGQSYPVIIGGTPFTIKINNPSQTPSFLSSGENEYLYKVLKGGSPEPKGHSFANLMILAKQLLESTHSIKTTKELSAKKTEIHNFTRNNYEKLKHSDMIRRLLAQYFMMHEYVNYHVEGAPATDIKKKYQQGILSGVKTWIEILKPHIPEHEVLNYIVSLYYNRSMVALASLINNKYRDYAYCPGAEKGKFNFLPITTITQGSNTRKTTMGVVKGVKLISFVSEDCPVSMVETVIKARQIASSKMDISLIVVPLDELSEKHFVMNRMVGGGNMLFVDDEKWREQNLSEKVKLPLFIEIGGQTGSL